MPPITQKKPSFPNTEAWEDFLDFSRWRVPETSVLAKRLFENLVIFSGNYLISWLVLTITAGVFVSGGILRALFTISVGWWAAEKLLVLSVGGLPKSKGASWHVHQQNPPKKPQGGCSFPPSSKVMSRSRCSGVVLPSLNHKSLSSSSWC